ncbi:BTB And C-terminal Kelch [Elasticomyces elasticus]|nr:BTB And C-terminal Kelch [Elasticomyces elasticus]KAK3647703.1 BTB And C-terminal Kelch [Elasticomyces elasticus]KAK4908120.1 BTB And C-terminal Kelch [Elasticomyces elasticus]KAK5748081.1 BTB And C-terminal Kelch [Elasticomyces elasticus]
MSGEFSRMYGKDMFSDVVIKFGDRELPAHKMVLMNGSEYFKKLLEDKTVKTIKLDDGGRPDVIEGLLRHVYRLMYAEDMRDLKNWRFHLDMAAAGKQYDLVHLKYYPLHWLGHFTGAKMDMDMVKEILRALPRYRYVEEKLVKKLEDAITNTHSRELLELPEFSNRFDMEPGARLPDLLQDPDFVKRFDAQSGRAVAYLVQFGKAFKDLQDKLDEHGTIWPQHFREIVEQATKKPDLPQPIVQAPANVNEDRTVVQPPARVKEERHQPMDVKEERKQQPVNVKEEPKQQLVKVKDEPKEAPSKKRKTESVVMIEID